MIFMFKGWIGELKTGFNLWQDWTKISTTDFTMSLFHRVMEQLRSIIFWFLLSESLLSRLRITKGGFMGQQINPLGLKLSTNPNKSFKTH